jgi:hypothetical protein
MSDLIVARFDAQTFSGEQIPRIGESPIQIVGLNEEGLAAAEEEIAYELAQRNGSNSTLDYTDPKPPIPLLLRGLRSTKTPGEVRPWREHLEPLTLGALAEGQALVNPTEKGGVRVDWQADICFGGVGAVAKSKIRATYGVSNPRKPNARKPKQMLITRTIGDRNRTIERTSRYDSWAVRNGIGKEER